MIIAFAVLVIWLFLVSFFLYKTIIHYNSLTAKTNKKNISDILDFLVQKEDFHNSEITGLKKQIEKLIKEEKTHYQKIGFLRFNPFERVGGEQSFIIALLNEEETGIVLNFLYIREGIRVYAKKVKKGFSEGYELSKEEKEAISKAE